MLVCGFLERVVIHLKYVSKVDVVISADGDELRRIVMTWAARIGTASSW